jgi:hypothetical protein
MDSGLLKDFGNGIRDDQASSHTVAGCSEAKESSLEDKEE